MTAPGPGQFYRFGPAIVPQADNFTKQLNFNFAQFGQVRKVLASAQTFFISNTGNDTNDGLTAGTPWLTLNPLVSKYDTGGQTVTITQVDNITHLITFPAWLGGGNAVYDGGGNSIHVASGAALLSLMQDFLTIQNITLQTDDANNNPALDIAGSGTVAFGASVTFAAGASSEAPTSARTAHMRVRNPGATLWPSALPNGGIAANVTYSVTGGSNVHLQITSGFAIWENTTVSMTGGIRFGTIDGSRGGCLVMNSGKLFAGNGWPTDPSILGRRFQITCPASVVETQGNLNKFPGDIAGIGWAGTTSPGPEYA